MVTQITEGTAFDRNGLPFRRRNIWPGIITAGVMAVVTAVVWLIAVTRPVDLDEAAACNPPPEQPGGRIAALGEPVANSTMIGVTPAKLVDTKIRVLNASGRGGQAAEVSGELRDLGFAQPTAANDPVYAGTPLTCQGQIRFGEKGQSAAAALWLVAPCTELLRDDRSDDSVDLAIGAEFGSLTHSDDIEAALAGLRPDATAPADPALIARIHSASC